MKKALALLLTSINWLVLKARSVFGLRRKIIFYFYLIQDLDILLPTLKKFLNSGFLVEAWVTPQLAAKSPRLVKALSELNVPIKKAANYDGKLSLKFNFFGVSAFITAVESTARAHRLAYQTVNIANYFGVKTYTFQHGYENIGLTYFDEEFPADFVDFASQKIFLWGEKSFLHPRVKPQTREKCISVGCPKSFSISESPKSFEKKSPIISVFENLHWTRYSDNYRFQFLNDLIAAAQAYPQITFIVKPHHAGKWLTSRFKGEFSCPENVIIADPSNSKWEPFTAPALIEISAAVITTPSTTAYDAAKMARPTAVVANDLELNNYRPLHLLASASDWNEFIGAALSGTNLGKFNNTNQEFMDKVSLPADGATTVFNFLCKEISV